MALKMKEGAISQGMQGNSRTQKDKETDATSLWKEFSPVNALIWA